MSKHESPFWQQRLAATLSPDSTSASVDNVVWGKDHCYYVHTKVTALEDYGLQRYDQHGYGNQEGVFRLGTGYDTYLVMPHVSLTYIKMNYNNESGHNTLTTEEMQAAASVLNAYEHANADTRTAMETTFGIRCIGQRLRDFDERNRRFILEGDPQIDNQIIGRVYQTARDAVSIRQREDALAR